LKSESAKKSKTYVDLYPKVVIENLPLAEADKYEKVVGQSSSGRKSRSGSHDKSSDSSRYEAAVNELEKPKRDRDPTHRSASVVSGHEEITPLDEDTSSASTSKLKSTVPLKSSTKVIDDPSDSTSTDKKKTTSVSASTAAQLRKIKQENVEAARRSAKKSQDDGSTEVIDLSDEDDEEEPPKKKVKVHSLKMSAVVYREKMPKVLGHTDAVLRPIDRSNPFVVCYDNSLDILIDMEPGKLNFAFSGAALGKIFLMWNTFVVFR
jgi:hypothetical protein